MQQSEEYKKECIDIAEKNKWIPYDDIQKDILDTYEDIRKEKSKKGLYEWKLDSSREDRIKEMELFIKRLEMILVGRSLLQK